jgi:hypothetical protein
MVRLAADGIFSFSIFPLRAIAWLGFATTVFGLIFGVFSVVSYTVGKATQVGWTSLVCLMLVFGGVQLLSLGLVSEYVGRIYDEVKRRPRYIVDRSLGVDRP